MHSTNEYNACASRDLLPTPGRHERGVRAVMLLAAATMVVEIAVGYTTRSMALLADGWHMATHVGALAIASVSYVLARRYAAHASFGFGTGKISALAGYTSALVLGIAALAMLVESMRRLAGPGEIDFASSLPVAVGGLVVNLTSIALLHHHEHDDHGHDHGEVDRHVHHDHSHRAVVLHVFADALTSALAIAALLVGYLTDIAWLDAATGIVGGAVIVHWAIELCRVTTIELLDVDPSGTLQQRVRDALERVDDTRVLDLHVWSLGGGRHGCVATVIASEPLPPAAYHARILSACEFSHLTIEIQRCDDDHRQSRRAA